MPLSTGEIDHGPTRAPPPFLHGVTSDSEDARTYSALAVAGALAGRRCSSSQDVMTASPRPAGVLHLQRFSDGGMLNAHGHFVVSDGVFAEVPTSGRTHESDPGLSNDPGRPALDVLFQRVGPNKSLFSIDTML